jgi:hypothetical protein
MEKTKTIDNLKNIFIQSYRWRNSNLSDTKSDKKFTLLSKLNIILFVISTVIILVSDNINDFATNSILTFASIFATLIIPVLIMVYDKFSNNPNSHLSTIQQQSVGAKNRAKLYKNFTSRFIFTSLENVFIAVLIIAMIIIYKALLVDFMDVNFFQYNFQENINLNGILMGLKIILVGLTKSIFVLLFIKFILFMFYSIGALGDFFQDGLEHHE